MDNQLIDESKMFSFGSLLGLPVGIPDDASICVL